MTSFRRSFQDHLLNFHLEEYSARTVTSLLVETPTHQYVVNVHFTYDLSVKLSHHSSETSIDEGGVVK